MRPGVEAAKGPYLGAPGRTPVVRVTAANSPRLSVAALLATQPAYRPRLIHRTHRGRRGSRRTGGPGADYAALLDAAHQQLGGPIVLVWRQLNTCPCCGDRGISSGWQLTRTGRAPNHR